MVHIQSEEQLAELIQSRPAVRVRGGGTKRSDSDAVSMANLAGVTRYEPSEYTFTAMAGTPLREVRQLLEQEQQYLPFDPPLTEAGATLGGTVAMGLSGSGRYQFGGVRDFLLGARMVTGVGELVTTGSQVVKNAAGFDLPKLSVGGLGQYGVLTELTFKVFPSPSHSATITFETQGASHAMELMRGLSATKFDLACLDINPAGELVVRIGGLRQALAARTERLVRSIRLPYQVAQDEEDANYWRDVGELAWAPAGHGIVKVTLAPSKALELATRLAPKPVRFCAGGHLAWIAWPWDDDIRSLDAILHELNCPGLLVVTGQSTLASHNPRLGPHPGGVFAQRLRLALDPDAKFAL